jgi:dihydrofolate synthase/folylpolyglutamate synthase
MIRVDEEFLPIKNGFAKKYYLKELLKFLDQPQAKLPTINIVGTNGKGSTSFYLSKALKQKYQKVGLFISPAFLYQNERIQINNEFISDEKLFFYYDQIKPYLDQFPLTFFEI